MRPRIFPVEQLRSPSECSRSSQPLPDDASSMDIASFFEMLFTMDPPSPKPPDRAVPVDRSWYPGAEHPPLDKAVVVKRHPLFEWDFPDVSEFRIGRSPRSSRRGFQNRFPSLKSRRTMRAASNIEFDALLDCELDPLVEAFLEQPIWLRYPLDGKLKRHKPDLFRLCNPIPEFWEVKYEHQAALPENEKRWPAIGKALAGMGYGFRVITERHLELSPRSDTIKGIYRDRHAPKPATRTMDALATELRKQGVLTVADILLRFPELSRQQVYHLVRRMFLIPDLLEAPLGADFRVRLGSGYVRWDENA
jgi:hypothetical protein